ncbi:hypothetical protein [Abyssisolibacter fermentans]|uniref:hypothetical protein n=1 Tax=Abyssisolibacter fermentans TaxID=1766203 RepID=UPI00082989AE|nr:hypothetical protein [Abyssisolibacter fermentans]
MRLKNATIFAIIGSIIGLIGKIIIFLFTLDDFLFVDNPILYFRLANAFDIIFAGSLVIFFVVLFSNQRKQKKQKGEA